MLARLPSVTAPLSGFVSVHAEVPAAHGQATQAFAAAPPRVCMGAHTPATPSSVHVEPKPVQAAWQAPCGVLASITRQCPCASGQSASREHATDTPLAGT